MNRINGKVGYGGANYSQDVKTVQTLLNRHASRMPGLQSLVVDGKIGPKTITAIRLFQQRIVGFANPDGRVDPGGKTWNALLSSGNAPSTNPAVPGTPASPSPVPATSAPSNPVGPGNIILTVSHGNKIPTNTIGSTSTHSGLYESTFVLSGGLTGTFSGSIYPDNMDVKGRVVDGEYPLHIGFHKGGGAAKQTQLTPKKSGVRCGLLVNCRNPVPVSSNNPTKTTSSGINVHNGFSRGSDGCLTIPWSEYKQFIQLFIDAFPNIDDWHTRGTNSGKQVGKLVIRA